MREVQAIALLSAVWLGAVLSCPVPPLAVAAAVGAALATRRPIVTLIAALALSSGLGARAERLYVPAQTATLVGEVLVVGDPRSSRFTVRVEVRTGEGDRLVAEGSTELGLGEVEVGQTLVVRGAVVPVRDSDWLRIRHVVGRLRVESVERVGSTAWWMVPANRLRRAVGRAGRMLGSDRSALYTGLVVGDDRLQSTSQRALFRSGGLTHLLAVSGQNVAFALAVVGPLLARLGSRQRLIVTVGTLVVFALATRLEPSVLRATATALMAAWALRTGRSTSGIVTLAGAGSLLLLIDPFLALSVGFQLSMAASGAILVVGPVIADALPGPTALRQAAAVTISAQAGVAPILMANFGPMSLSSLPANLLAGPAAGFVMTWGLSAGLVAAVVPEPMGRVLQWPVGLAVGWIAGVASWAGRLPLPSVGGPGLAIGLAGLGMVWLLGGDRSWWRVAPRLMAGAALMAGALAAIPTPPRDPTVYGGLAYLPRTGSSPSVLILPASPSENDIERLVSDRVLSVDLVLAVGGGRRTSEFVIELRTVMSIGDVIAAPLHRVVGARVLDRELIIGTPWGPVSAIPEVDRRHLDVQWPRPPP